jgi:hyperosmotically inducible protein
MAYKHGKIAAVLLLGALLGSCQSVTGRTVGQNIDDANTTAAVKSELAREKASSLTRIDVDTNNGVVALNGVVESGEERQRAAKIARGVSGVKRVINNLQVQR